MAAIEVDALTKSYRGRRGISEVSFTVAGLLGTISTFRGIN